MQNEPNYKCRKSGDEVYAIQTKPTAESREEVLKLIGMPSNPSLKVTGITMNGDALQMNDWITVCRCSECFNDDDAPSINRWSPQEFHDSFEAIPDEPEVMDFSMALLALKGGKRIARKKWMVNEMWLAISCADTRDVPANHFWSPHNAIYARNNGGTAKVLPAITMKIASGEIMMGWTPTTMELFADDWLVLD